MKKTFLILTLMAVGSLATQAAIQVDAEKDSLQEGLAFYWDFDQSPTDYKTATGETLTLTQTVLPAADAPLNTTGGVDGSGCVKAWGGNNLSFYGQLSEAGISADDFTLSLKLRHVWKSDYRALLSFQLGGVEYQLQSTYDTGTSNTQTAQYLYKYDANTHTEVTSVNNVAANAILSDNSDSGEWVNVIITGNGTDLTLYIDGMHASGAYSVSSSDVLGDFRLSTALDGTRWSDAWYDDLAIWNRQLNSNELAYLSSGGLASGTVPAIPEPATATLSLLAFAGLAARRRRK